MEKWQRDRMTNMFPDLIESTRVEALLLAKLVANSLITYEELWMVDSRPTNTEKAVELYQMLMYRVRSYDVLMKIFQERGQTGPYSILKEGYDIEQERIKSESETQEQKEDKDRDEKSPEDDNSIHSGDVAEENTNVCSPPVEEFSSSLSLKDEGEEGKGERENCYSKVKVDEPETESTVKAETETGCEQRTQL